MIHIYTGDGKGKTSAAVGMAARFHGAGGKVQVFRFLKGSSSGELETYRELGIEVRSLSRDYGFYCDMSAEERAAVHREHDAMLDEAAAIDGGMIILDEVICALAEDAAETVRLWRLIENSTAELVLTGRGATPELIAAADYVSEITSIKHPYDTGTPARRGIEY